MKEPERVIISPHMDDAMISLGGHLLLWRGYGIRVTVYDFFTVSNFTHWGFGDADKVSEIRKREEMAVMGEIGVIATFMDYPESVVRGHRISDEDLGYPDRIVPEID